MSARTGNESAASRSGAQKRTKRSNDPRLRIALSAGCPCGIGPEITFAAIRTASQSLPDVHFVLFAERASMTHAARLGSSSLDAIDVNTEVRWAAEIPPDSHRFGEPDELAGRAQLACIDGAIDAVISGECHAMVTAPASKHAIRLAGVDFVGHTEHIEQRVGAGSSVMFFVGSRLRVSLVTTHLALRSVADAVTPERVARVVRATVKSLQHDLGVSAPRIAVTALNPHAGEHGAFGDEDHRVIAPAIRDALGSFAHDEAVSIVGPRAAETAFREAAAGQHDAVVAMYHDQATIASKLLDFGHAVNMTIGLPVLRMSVDHGTAYDIAGRGIADSSSLVRAIELAVQVATHRNARS